MADSPRIEELRRRVQQDPASIAFATLAEEYRRAGLYDDAIAVCRAGLHRHPSYISAHVTLGRALLEVGEFEEAREELELVLRVAPENLAAIRGLAEIHHRRGDATETHDFPETGGAETPVPAAAAPVEPETSAGSPAPAPTPPPALSFVTQQSETSEDRALAGLEEFLEAIVRVRKTARGIHVA
jgi:tetratricopeptide (TPR) repeat protein